MYAFVTKQGTAILETALCNEHYTEPIIASSSYVARAMDDYNGKGMVDCTGNDELFCQVCGRRD